MNDIIEHIVNDINIYSLETFSEIGFFKVRLAEEEKHDEVYSVSSDCAFIIGFYSTKSSCNFDLVIESPDRTKLVFRYKVEINKLFYAIDDKFIIPSTKLHDSKIYIQNFIGNVENLHIIKNNISVKDRISLIPKLMYCRINNDKYLIYDKGICYIRDSLYLDRDTYLYTEIQNIKVCKFIKSQNINTYIVSYIENETFNTNWEIFSKTPMNFIQSLYKSLFASR